MERKKVIQHIRGLYKTDLSASRHWQELVQQLTHDRCGPNFFYLSVSLYLKFFTMLEQFVTVIIIVILRVIILSGHFL